MSDRGLPTDAPLPSPLPGGEREVTPSRAWRWLGLKVIEVARTNTNTYFDFVEKLFGVKSPSELVELTTAHSRVQFETATAQGKELAALAQKVATETAEPIKTGVEKAMKKVA